VKGLACILCFGSALLVAANAAMAIDQEDPGLRAAWCVAAVAWTIATLIWFRIWRRL
jgi:hypothetical protein